MNQAIQETKRPPRVTRLGPQDEMGVEDDEIACPTVIQLNDEQSRRFVAAVQAPAVGATPSMGRAVDTCRKTVTEC